MIAERDAQHHTLGRRDVLKTFIGMGVLTTIPASVLAKKIEEPRYRIRLHHLHTGEDFDEIYRIGNRYLPDAFEKLTYFLRDFRTGDTHAIDPRLIDVIASVYARSGQDKPYEIISGYRSPKTNAMLRKTSTGVAKKSYHMKGQAIDLRIPDYSTSKLRDTARALKAGGVGYYPGSNFIHVDTGDVRSW